MSTAAHVNQSDRLSWRTLVSLFSINIMILMCALDVSAVNISLKTMMADLHAPLTAIQWVVISYMLTIACMLVQFARLGDLRNKKTIFFTGVAVFTAASVWCGLAPSAGLLIVGRVLQGLGAAMCQSLAAAIITEIAGPKHRGRALGLFFATFAIGLMLGPSVGGVCVSLWNWRAIFFINIPIGAAALTLIWKFVPQLVPPHSNQRFDILGAVIAAISLGSYSLGMVMAQRHGFGDSLVLALFAIAVVGIATFIQVEKRVASPMVNMKLFTNPIFTFNLLVNFFSFMSSACPTVLPLFLMQGRGFTVGQASLYLMILPCAIAVTSYFSGWLADRFGTRLISFVGLLILTCGLLSMSFVTLETAWWDIALRYFFTGFGIGVFQTPNNSAIIGAAPKEFLGVASGLLTYTRVLGQGSGMPLVFTAFTIAASAISPSALGGDFTNSSPEAMTAGIQAAYFVVGAIHILCITLALVAWYFERKRDRLAAEQEAAQQLAQQAGDVPQAPEAVQPAQETQTAGA